jgi:glycosyltransferase involved in cell wall biosynthesis
MKLGFYYHISGRKNIDGIYTQGAIGVFIDSIAENVSELICFMHILDDSELDNEDYKIASNNINFVWMDKKTTFYHRILNSRTILSKIEFEVGLCDTLLIRAPSPLAPYFYTQFKNITSVFYLIVGDYREVGNNLKLPWWRQFAVKTALNFNDLKLRSVLANCSVFVNSRPLYKQYKNICDRVFEIKTTTLSQSDFFYREDTCLNDEINILYTGRLDFSKGLIELIEATSILLENASNISLHIVGWELEENGVVKKELLLLVDKLNIFSQVKFYGKLKLGNELNSMYRMADVFVLPSYNEGFPRVIWEAMANCLPVITTKVGGIPDILVHDFDVLLIDPRSSDEIAKSIERIISNKKLRREIISNAFLKAKGNTSKIQSKFLIDQIEGSMQAKPLST